MERLDLQKGDQFQGIIDIYDQNAEVNLREAKELGIVAVIHQTSLDLERTDKLYAKRKAEAKALGLRWGAYHVVSAENVDEQLERFFSLEDGTDPDVLMALDWEETSRGVMSPEQLDECAGKFRERRGSYPVIYGGHLIPESAVLKGGDAVLHRCPLWYIWLPQGPPKLPEKTWTTVTLHQFDTEKRRHGAPPQDILPGADFNRYKGTEDDLRNAWPFHQG